MKRTTIKLKRPNGLFEKWLQEWRDEAASRNSDLQHVFGKALKSLKKYPLPLQNGRDCLILENFGTRICLQLDRKLAEHKKLFPEGGDVNETEERETETSPKPKKARRRVKEQEEIQAEIEISQSNETKQRKQYIPAWRSASYAILIALYNKSSKNGTSGEMNKEELLIAAQSFTDTSMHKPLPGSFYTGWSSMSQLVKKELVLRKGNPPKFTLTTEGLSLAKQLPNFDFDCSNDTTPNTSVSSTKESLVNTKLVAKKPDVSSKAKRGGKKVLPEPVQDPDVVPVNIHPASERNPITCDINNVKVKQKVKCSQASDQNQAETLIFLPRTFQVVLLVDTQETSKGDEMVQELRAGGTLLEVRRLKVGDFVWICRNSSNQELVLPYIIERKRLDDLAHSIKDGRFHEQKFRLKQCGIPNCIYLVERQGERHYSLPLTTLLQAATNTQVVDNFIVKFTAGHRESVVYLSSLSTMFTNIFSNKTLISCEKAELPEFNIQDDCMSLMTFSDFSRTSGKFRIFRVREMFVRHLLQLRGLSVEKALSIVGNYPTPSHLIQAYRDGGDEKMLAGITSGALRRPIGIAISKAVYQLYTSYTLK